MAEHIAMNLDDLSLGDRITTTSGLRGWVSGTSTGTDGDRVRIQHGWDHDWFHLSQIASVAPRRLSRQISLPAPLWKDLENAAASGSLTLSRYLEQRLR